VRVLSCCWSGKGSQCDSCESASFSVLAHDIVHSAVFPTNHLGSYPAWAVVQSLYESIICTHIRPLLANWRSWNQLPDHTQSHRNVALELHKRIANVCMQEALIAQVDKMANHISDIHLDTTRNTTDITALAKQHAEFKSRQERMVDKIPSAHGNGGSKGVDKSMKLGGSGRGPSGPANPLKREAPGRS
jgi:hypothetical protein